MFESDDDLIDLEKVTGQPGKSKRPGAKFQPWHKPRKQWIRDNQWWGIFKKVVVKSNNYKDINPLKYFGLPGGDLLDVDFFRRRLSLEESQKEKLLLIHGFINNRNDKSIADSRMSVLLDEPNVHHESQIEHFNFNSLGNDAAASRRRVNAIGPYHLVNLDFCDCIFKQETLNSIQFLMDFQIKRQHGTPWIFCLTTRVDKNGVNSDLFNKLNGLLKKLDHVDILEKIRDCFESTYQTITNGTHLSDPDLSEDTFSELIQICVVLWIVNYALTHDSGIQLESSVKYHIYDGNGLPDMFSFVFKLEKKDRAVSDDTGLAGENSLPVELTLDQKLRSTIHSLVKLSQSLDLDGHLNCNVELKREYAKQMKDLLESSGWDVSSYLDIVCPDLS